MNYYVLVVVDDIEPELEGPFRTKNGRDSCALDMKKEVGNNSSIFWLDIDQKGVPKVGSYSGQFFLE